MLPFYNPGMGALARSGLIQYMLAFLSDEVVKIFIAIFGIPKPKYFDSGIHDCSGCYYMILFMRSRQHL